MSTDALVFLLPPLAMCLLLSTLHAYLGLHVLAREVVFVDLALAQVAALGVVIASIFGLEHDDWRAYFFSVGLTLLVAFFLALANRASEKFPQEALIGVIYAFFSAAIILLLDRMSHGSEHLKHALMGQILWVSWGDVLKVLGIYSAVGFLHWLWRRPLLEQSFGRQTGFIWDLAFYALFGIVISSSVQVAGVLLVFAFLIVPGLVAGLFARDLRTRIWMSWILGWSLSVLGMLISFFADLPAGAVMVLVFTLAPILLVTLFGARAKV